MEQNKEIIYLEQIIAGALLKFNEVDSIYLRLLLDDFLEVNKDMIEYQEDCFTPRQLKSYVCRYRDHGKFYVSRAKSLDSFIREEECTVKEKYEKVAGKLVLDYFEKIDVAEFNKKRKEIIREEKECILNEGHILLITSDKEVYNELVKYGFKNIDYFNSIVRADKYFKAHPEALDNYHMIFTSTQATDCSPGSVEIEKIIGNKITNQDVFGAQISMYEYSGIPEYVTYDIKDSITNMKYEIRCHSYTEFYDRIIKHAIINHVADRIKSNPIEFKPIGDNINSNRLPLPTKKSDLKILYLVQYKKNKQDVETIAKQLGLNITVKEDSEYGIGQHVKSALGDYDIIIVSNWYSHDILRMNNESTEQCKDTGRELTLLTTYYFQPRMRYNEDGHLSGPFGEDIRIRSIFGGNYSHAEEVKRKDFRVLRFKDEDGSLDDNQNKISIIKTTIEQAIHIYNEKLLEIQQSPISDLDFKTIEEYEQEYVEAEIKDDERIKKILEPINNFEELKNNIETYLAYKNLGYIRGDLKDLKITEMPDGIRIENIYQGRTLCAITLSHQLEQRNLKVFSIETLTKKGTLGEPEVVGLYTSSYKNVPGTPKHANELQMNAVMATKKKIDALIVPLIEQARNEKQKRKESKKRILKKNSQKNNNM